MTATPTQHPTISLCMIIKNEENFLPVCLESAKDLVDEIIIIDTGCTDKSVEIARHYGAKIYPYEWTQDFAAARNESIKYASSDWILYLDADERLLPEDADKIREIVKREDLTAVNIRVVIPQPPGNVIKFYAIDYCRLFRNLPGITFEGIAHEQVLPSIHRLGGKVVKSDINIDHWGHNVAKEKRREREERNLQTLKAEVARTPEDPFNHYNLALTHRFLGDTQSAIREFEQVLATNDGDLKKELIGITHTFLSQSYLAVNDYKKAWENSQTAIEMLPEEPLPNYIAATTAFAQHKFETAIEYLQKIIDKFENHEAPVVIADMDISQVYFDLGNCFYLDHRINQAVNYYEKALEINPNSKEINFNLGNCFFIDGKYQAARKIYEKVLGIDSKFTPAQMNLEKVNSILNT